MVETLMIESMRPKLGRNPFAQPRALWRVDFRVPANAVPPLEQAFEDIALATSCFEEDEAAAVWSVQVLLSEKPDAADIRRRIKSMGLNGATPPEPVIAELKPDDWQIALERDFPPLMVGRFFVHGAHAKARRPLYAIPLQVEAGMAFGSGEHATTSGCLLAIDRLARLRRMTRVLDMGCGSGILSIAAAKRWRRASVLAVDVDRVAAAVAGRNARVNQVGRAVRVIAADGYKAALVKRRGAYDLILANILARPLAKMSRQLAANLARGGVAVLSGLLSSQEALVLAAHRAQGLRLVARIRRDGWNTLVMTR